MTHRSGRVPVLTTLIATAGLLAACEGPTGPEGPQGIQGIQGQEGPQGPIGNANVISGRVTLTEADWSTTTVQLRFNTSPGTYFYAIPARYADVAVSDLTLDVINNGAVLLYTAPDDARPNEFVPLPYRFRFIDTTVGYYRVLDARVQEGNIRFYYYYEVLDANVTPPSALEATQPDRVFRWVIIPPAAASTLSTLPLAAGPDAVLAELEERGFEAEEGEGGAPR